MYDGRLLVDSLPHPPDIRQLSDASRSVESIYSVSSSTYRNHLHWERGRGGFTRQSSSPTGAPES